MTPHNPLTKNELEIYTKQGRLPKRRILATPPNQDGVVGYYDIDTYGITGGGGSGLFLDFGDRFDTNPGFFIDLGLRFG